MQYFDINPKITISNKNGIETSSFNLEKTSFSSNCDKSTIEYLEFLSKNTGWLFDRSKWTFDNFHLYEFTKKIVKPGVNNFNTAVRENFLSLAITGNESMEYTLDEKNILLK